MIIPVLDFTQTTCLSFYYFMHGESTATLRVYSEYFPENEGIVQEFWSIAGDRGQSWQKTSVTVKPNDERVSYGLTFAPLIVLCKVLIILKYTKS